MNKPLFLMLILVVSCTSTSELIDYQAKVKEKRVDAFKTREAALQSELKNCVEIKREKSTKIVIDEKAPLLLQETERGILANFRVACFEKKAGESLLLKLESEHRGGSWSNVHFMIPALSLFNEKREAVKIKPGVGRVIQPLMTAWRFATDQQVPTALSGKVYVLIEADNRHGTGSVSGASSETVTYAAGILIPVSVSKDVKAYPTGTVHVSLENNL